MGVAFVVALKELSVEDRLIVRCVVDVACNLCDAARDAVDRFTLTASTQGGRGVWRRGEVGHGRRVRGAWGLEGGALEGGRGVIGIWRGKGAVWAAENVLGEGVGWARRGGMRCGHSPSASTGQHQVLTCKGREKIIITI